MLEKTKGQQESGVDALFGDGEERIFFEDAVGGLIDFLEGRQKITNGEKVIEGGTDLYCGIED